MRQGVAIIVGDTDADIFENLRAVEEAGWSAEWCKPYEVAVADLIECGECWATAKGIPVQASPGIAATPHYRGWIGPFDSVIERLSAVKADVLIADVNWFAKAPGVESESSVRLLAETRGDDLLAQASRKLATAEIEGISEDEVRQLAPGLLALARFLSANEQATIILTSDYARQAATFLRAADVSVERIKSHYNVAEPTASVPEHVTRVLGDVARGATLAPEDLFGKLLATGANIHELLAGNPPERRERVQRLQARFLGLRETDWKDLLAHHDAILGLEAFKSLTGVRLHMTASAAWLTGLAAYNSLDLNEDWKSRFILEDFIEWTEPRRSAAQSSLDVTRLTSPANTTKGQVAVVQSFYDMCCSLFPYDERHYSHLAGHAALKSVEITNEGRELCFVLGYALPPAFVDDPHGLCAGLRNEERGSSQAICRFLKTTTLGGSSVSFSVADGRTRVTLRAVDS